MCANDEAPASKSQPVPAEAESTGSVSETRRCRRYKPLFPLHFELDADSATVYIDGGLAARVCSVVKNSLDEIRG
ncbi:unnamed protein product [Anisakis simplex]|uniref:Transposase n=1 Tax=Anisakis simplex TaxID=6269 RepID=A0A0M3JM88_ANISI|nr:unnamed protein product [Anisakis simplex]